MRGAETVYWLHTGQIQDGTGLYYYNARYYDPWLGRFISADTVVPELGNPQDLNRYAYVRNSPLRYTDPTGHCIPGVNCPGTKDETGGGVSGVTYPDNVSTKYLYAEGVKYGSERDASDIWGIVMHMTAGNTVEGAIDAFIANGTSANYIVDTDGTIYVVVPANKSAWHAGGTTENPAEWKATKPDGNSTTLTGIDVNYHTIGIEVVGATGTDYTAAQKTTTTQLVRWLAQEYNIHPPSIIAHMDVCPPPAKYDGREYLGALRTAVQKDKPPLFLPASGRGPIQ